VREHHLIRRDGAGRAGAERRDVSLAGNVLPPGGGRQTRLRQKNRGAQNTPRQQSRFSAASALLHDTRSGKRVRVQRNRQQPEEQRKPISLCSYGSSLPLCTFNVLFRGTEEQSRQRNQDDNSARFLCLTLFLCTIILFPDLVSLLGTSALGTGHWALGTGHLNLPCTRRCFRI
jgi:hypothetical protein